MIKMFYNSFLSIDIYDLLIKKELDDEYFKKPFFAHYH